MKTGRFTEEQIIGVLKQPEAGRKVAELSREMGVSEATIYTWKSKYGGMEVNEAQRLKGLERRTGGTAAVALHSYVLCRQSFYRNRNTGYLAASFTMFNPR